MLDTHELLQMNPQLFELIVDNPDSFRNILESFFNSATMFNEFQEFLCDFQVIANEKSINEVDQEIIISHVLSHVFIRFGGSYPAFLELAEQLYPTRWAIVSDGRIRWLHPPAQYYVK